MARLLPTTVPVLTQHYQCPGAETARSLFVSLPGIGDTAQEYEQHGFIDAVKQKGWSADLIVVDAHYGYYANRTILDRLHGDVFEPAKALGYQNRWLVGISLGGFGALLYASRHVPDVTGVIVMAPYLGRSALVEEIAAAGGMRGWHPSTIAQHDHERHVWSWLKQYEQDSARLPTLCLAYGEGDSFVRGHHVLSDILPPEHVFSESGKHDWTTWKKLWLKILASSALRLQEDEIL